jgi:predicted negative regulator of RcsB-dependent stress response
VTVPVPVLAWHRLEAVVKKLIVLVLLAAAGAVAWRKVQSDRAEQALWAEVTDPVT